MATDPIVIVSAARTPIGGLLGDFAALAAWQLGAVAIKAAVERAGVPGDAVDEVLMGNCLMAGQGQAPARQAMLRRRPAAIGTGAVTLSKMCGSGMRAMMFAHDMLAAGSADVMVAGGMESMTNAPHLMFARKGVRYGAAQLYDHMAIDGLEDAYETRQGDGRVRRGMRRASTASRARRRTSSRSPPRSAPRPPTRTAASTGRWHRSPSPGRKAARP